MLCTTREFIQKVEEIVNVNGAEQTSSAETEPFKGIAQILPGLWRTLTG